MFGSAGLSIDALVCISKDLRQNSIPKAHHISDRAYLTDPWIIRLVTVLPNLVCGTVASNYSIMIFSYCENCSIYVLLITYLLRNTFHLVYLIDLLTWFIIVIPLYDFRIMLVIIP